MKMTKAQYEVWQGAVEGVGEHYNDLPYFINYLDSFDGQAYYYGQQGIQWFDDVFPEFKDDTRRFVRVWLGDEPIEVEDKYEKGN